MRLLAPLGFIGLIAIAVLILIYIIKPNYQQKVVSSTFVWHRALKLRRRRAPISRLRNILLLICQILVLALCAWLLVRPVITAEEPDVRMEKIAIIDASGNMRATENGQTRFERAVYEVKDLIAEVDDADGVLTVIVAADEPRFLANSVSGDALDELDRALDALIVPDAFACTYGAADIDGAVDLAQTVLDDTSDAEVLLYTATEYIDKGNITVVDVSEVGEWNAAILSCDAALDENIYTFTVEVASYGRDIELWLHLDVYGANSDPDSDIAGVPPVMLSTLVRCSNDNVQTVVFNTKNTEVSVYSYTSVHVYIESISDSLDSDNNYYLYGGVKEPVKVQYYSNKANNFFAGWLMGAREILKSRWAIELTEVSSTADAPLKPATEGFDFYIFEHEVPSIIPTDGVVLLVDLDKTPEGLGLTLGETVTGDFTLGLGAVHQATNLITANNITITEYKRVLNYYSGFEPLLYCGGDPIYLVCNEPELKVAILSLNLNKSNLSVLVDFPILMYNMFNYFLPSTASDPQSDTPKYVFDVGDSVTLNARGAALTVLGPDPDITEPFTRLPENLVLKNPGQYTLTQTTLRGETVIESFYVKMPVSESNIVREADSLKRVQINVRTKAVDTDLMLYFAIALVVLLFLEWLLHSIEHMSR